MKAQALPKGYHTLNPYINVKDAPAALEFYKNAFRAKETGDMDQKTSFMATGLEPLRIRSDISGQ